MIWSNQQKSNNCNNIILQSVVLSPHLLCRSKESKDKSKGMRKLSEGNKDSLVGREDKTADKIGDIFDSLEPAKNSWSDCMLLNCSNIALYICLYNLS